MQSYRKKLLIITISFLFVVVNATATDTTTADNQTSEANSQTKILREQIIKSDIDSIGQSQDSVSKKVLEELIAEVSALKISSKKPEKEAETKDDPNETNVSSETEPEIAKNNSDPNKPEQAQDAISTNQSQKAVDPQTARLEALLKEPEKVTDPFMVAEVLFKFSNLEYAGRFYEIALSRINKEANPLDYQWALFQAANCKRYSDPAGSYKLYGQLISDYPESYWAQSAKVQQSITNWYQKNKPQKLLEIYISDPNSL